MQLRAPAVPLITSDPYFSIWSMTDTLTEDHTRHWTGVCQRLLGKAVIDGVSYRFMGLDDSLPPLKQTNLDINALSTKYRFAAGGIELDVVFTSPLLPDDLRLVSAPVTYVAVRARSTDGAPHRTEISLTVGGEICLNRAYEFPTRFDQVEIPGVTCGRVGSTVQKPLTRAGDNLRINWGYAYLASNAPGAEAAAVETHGEYGTPSHDMTVCAPVETDGTPALFVIAYDDVQALEYFRRPVYAYWKKDGTSIDRLIAEAFDRYDERYAACEAFSEKMRKDATAAGTEKYADLLVLAYRQSMAAHKLCCDEEGRILFISKENFSNGCAATVDVTYPSIPLFLLYNPELVKGMLRPVFRYAESDVWFYNFAPHDVGTYPLLNGQVYSDGTCPGSQMPVEECGNMLIATAAAAVAEKDASFALEHWDSLRRWCDYLLKEGLYPKNQLCTDDFAGHLANNCNLALKAIMGVASFGILCRMTNRRAEADDLTAKARSMAEEWLKSAAREDGAFRLAFDRPDSFSMKYNAVWDMVFGTGIFPDDAFRKETASYVHLRSNRYGLLLDNRAAYTKSDWLVWSATLSHSREEFEKLVERLWLAYHESPSRVPLTDWYDTATGKQVGFQNRSVQGGLFIKLLRERGVCNIRRL